MIIGGIIKVMRRMKGSGRRHYDITIRSRKGLIRFDIEVDDTERPRRVKEAPCSAADPMASPSCISTRWPRGGKKTLTPDEA